MEPNNHTGPIGKGERRLSRVEVALAGHTGDVALATAGLADPDPTIRASGLMALDRLGALDDQVLQRALADPEQAVRLSAARLAGKHPSVDLKDALNDEDSLVVEMAAWAVGEQRDTKLVGALSKLCTTHPEPLCREAAAAALGAIGHRGGLAAILVATDDVPTVRRRAVLALAAFEGEEVDAALERALTDKDWQVRQAAEDLQA